MNHLPPLRHIDADREMLVGRIRMFAEQCIRFKGTCWEKYFLEQARKNIQRLKAYDKLIKLERGEALAKRYINGRMRQDIDECDDRPLGAYPIFVGED